MFENQKIEIIYQNYNSFITWATLIKQKPKIEFSHIYINVTNYRVPPPFELCFVSSHLPVFESFPRCCCSILACVQSPIALSLLGKINILASMFVCRFVTCQNLQFWQVCSFVGLSVCLSVCLLVCQFCQA